MQEFVQRVRNTATSAGGGYIPYSQMLEPTNTLIRMMPATKGGICLALCAKWIAEHANDRSLWTWLCTPGTTNVRQGMITNLMVNFNEGVVTDAASGAFNATVVRPASQGGAVWQVVVTDRYLAHNGVIRRGMARARMSANKSFHTGAAMGVALTRDLDPKLWNGSNFYVMIIVSGAAGAHAICVYFGSKDIAFFDPNFGEFYFETRDKFTQFLRHFWTQSGYRNSFNSYYLMDYGKGMR